MDFLDLFDTEPTVPYKMPQQMFFDATKKLLNNIVDDYSRAWQNRLLTEEEYPDEDTCEKCTGCGVFKDSGGEE